MSGVIIRPRSGLISRRDWLRNAAVFGAGLPASMALSRLSFGQAAQPQRGGVMTAVLKGDPANFDPMSNSSYLTIWAIGPCYNTLLMMDPKRPDDVIGDLAESWEMSPDGLSYTFRLVRNARFHDGKPLTSADVKYSFDTMRDPPKGVVSVKQSLFSSVKEIQAPDDYTVRFLLNRKSPSLLLNLANGWLVVMPKHVLEAKGAMKDVIVGSGPFMFKEYNRGVSLELVRNPNYHVKDRPYLDGIKYFMVLDETTRYAYMRAGQIDVYENSSANESRRAQKELAASVIVHENGGYGGDAFAMNTRRKPFDDIRVRKAFALSIDHDQAVKVVMGGNGLVGGLTPAGKWALAPAELEKVPGFGKNVEANRAEAKKLLAEAGFPNGMDTTITGRRGVGTHEDRVVFLADQFAKIGVRAKIDLQETAAYFDTMNTTHSFNIATITLGAGANDPDSIFSDYLTCTGGANWSGLCVPELDALFQKQTETVDVEERRKLVNQMDLAGEHAFGAVNLYYQLKFTMTSKRVQNYLMHPNNDNNTRFQDVWLSKS